MTFRSRTRASTPSSPCTRSSTSPTRSASSPRPGACSSAAGVAIFVTPNRLTFGRPDEIIDPYHHVELSADELEPLVAARFERVELRGVFGSERYLGIVASERVTLDRLLALDPLRLRRLVPRRARQVLYDVLLSRLRRDPDPAAGTIEAADFEVRGERLDESLDLIAVCRGPR